MEGRLGIHDQILIAETAEYLGQSVEIETGRDFHIEGLGDSCCDQTIMALSKVYNWSSWYVSRITLISCS